MQIRETKAGTYPPLVYQPLRSPKSPYAKCGGPGSSCTLPAKLGARLMTQSLAYNQRRPKPKRLLTNELSNCSQSKSAGVAEENSLLEQRQQPDAATLLPRFLHSDYSDSYYPSDRQLRKTSSHRSDNHPNTTSYSRQQPQHDHHTTTNLSVHDEEARDNHPNLAHHLDQNSVDRNTRSSSEENSNASSGGYFSEDGSNQSITTTTTSSEICGSPFELKVQLRQCSDEKILKKDLSKDNLLGADYLSRPNEKCKFQHSFISAQL